MRLTKVLLVTFILILIVWLILFLRTPKLEASLVEIKFSSPDNRWEDGIVNNKDILQLEITFEVKNKYQKTMPLIGIYSKKLNKFSLGTKHINSDFHQQLCKGEKRKFTIAYLINDKNVIRKIDFNRDFIVYSSFVATLVWDSVENTWRGNYIIAPLFGLGFSKVKNSINQN